MVVVFACWRTWHTRAHIERFVIHCFVSTFIWNNYYESKGVRACISKPSRKKAAYPTELLDTLLFSLSLSLALFVAFKLRSPTWNGCVHGKNELYIRVRKTLLSIQHPAWRTQMFLSVSVLSFGVPFRFLFLCVACIFSRFSFTWFKLDENRINILCWALPSTSPAPPAPTVPNSATQHRFFYSSCLPPSTHTHIACVCKMKFLKRDEKIGEKCRSGIDLIKNISFHLLDRLMKR